MKIETAFSMCLAFGILAALPAAAAPELAAAFQSALGGVAAFRTAASLPSDPAPAASPAAWKTIMAKILSAGRYSPADDPFPATYGLQDIRGPVISDHAASYINAFGAMGLNGVFAPAYTTLVSEVWTKEKNGDFRIDQWLFETDLDGRVVDRTHRVMIQTPDGTGVGEDQYDRLDDSAAAARVKAEYGALIARWAAYKPARRLR